MSCRAIRTNSCQTKQQTNVRRERSCRGCSWHVTHMITAEYLTTTRIRWVGLLVTVVSEICCNNRVDRVEDYAWIIFICCLCLLHVRCMCWQWISPHAVVPTRLEDSAWPPFLTLKPDLQYRLSWQGRRTANFRFSPMALGRNNVFYSAPAGRTTSGQQRAERSLSSHSYFNSF